MNEKEFKLITLTSKEYVGCYIKFFRERIGLSQSKLAKIIKANAGDIGLYERGTKIPDKPFLDKLYLYINKYVEDNQIKVIR